jgi:hypothetical protein
MFQNTRDFAGLRHDNCPGTDSILDHRVVRVKWALARLGPARAVPFGVGKPGPIPPSED